ncbi:hypothetical protein K437DRAFT_256639 [Tilletiaria anomala UBC 951]|uniref:Transmembrane protein 135 N-terminal domain-containing protein n=1 Tax=Tilletiaria anomala (strain ATCC 24038 / CBS 436.72 / UBC 951) TaxID=1037660 RepID=A0A066W3F3_TILAU|nr:uncharacterized protein K437DRAFT_256639 [Tilletiaria anomala UBC 951]KDN45295.1 hypothetical protein K437DRAFT_256639 [Tilletiaria anomala UBC 951]
MPPATGVRAARASAHRTDAILAALRPVLGPASKAYLLGYLVEAIPAILKHVLLFINSHIRRLSREAKRLNEARELELEWQQQKEENQQEAGGSASDSSKRARIASETQAAIAAGKQATLDTVRSVLHDMPVLLRAIVQNLISSATSLRGMAVCSMLTIVLWKLVEATLKNTLERLQGAGSKDHAVKQSSRSVAICFAASAVASASSLTLLQSASSGSGAPSDTGRDARRFMRTSPNSSVSKTLKGLIATPLAPGGHFLARLTTLSLPETPVTPPDPDSQLLHGGCPSSPISSFRMGSGSLQEKGELIARINSPGTEANSRSRPKRKATPSPTIDFTLFALVRGLDTFVRVLLFLLAGGAAASGADSQTAGVRKILRVSGKGKADSGTNALLARMSRKVGNLVVNQVEGLIFVVCCAEIMFSWFYYPERLPPTYNKWITNLAAMDQRLLTILRCRRFSKPYYWCYGDPNVSPAGIDLCSSLSESLGHPYQWGDVTRLPSTSAEAKRMLQAAHAKNKQIAETEGKEFSNLSCAEQDAGYILAGAKGPRGRGEMGGIPCEIVHCGVGGASCLANAGLRWFRGWKASMAIYVPVHLLPRLLFGHKLFLQKPLASILKVALGSARSAAFLATFIALSWFPVCVGRTLVLPKLFPNISHNFWDGGLGPAMGSWACGFSVFIEEKRKRAEMALYVAPRALFAITESLRPGWISDGQNKSARVAERIIFGLSAGLVITTAKYRPGLLRGIPSILAWVLKEPGQKKVRINALRGGG